MDIVNVVMTCSLRLPPGDAPFEELLVGKKYYHIKEGVITMVFRTGKVKVFSKRYPPPDLGYYDNCVIENVVARTTVPALPIEEMKELLERHGFVVSDREKVNAKLAYVQSLRATVRIFPRPGARYKAMIFAPSPEAAAEVERLLASALG